MRPLFPRVGIFGAGLLGGSVGLALRERFLAEEVHAFDPRPEALHAAVALGAATHAHTELGDWIENLDLGILAAPVGAIPDLVAAIAPYATERTLFTDVASVKKPVVEAARGRFQRFIGGHPMAGSERAGVENAHAGLLENAVWVLTPEPGQDEDLKRLTQLVEQIGAYPLVLDPALHDRLVARISHLPYLLAVAANLLIKEDEHKELLMFLAAGGFRDLTRVASGSVVMSRDMVIANRAEVHKALADFRGVLDEIEAALDDPEALKALGEAAKRTRDALPVVKRSLLPVRHELVVQLPDRPGELARITTALGAAGVNIKDIEVLTIRDAGGALRLGFAEPEERDAARQVLAGIGYRVV